MVGKINVFGDSITWGSKDTECGGWADRLKVYFSKTGLFKQVRNLGVSGETSRNLLERLERETIPRKSHRGLLTIIAVPINDARYEVNSEGEKEMGVSLEDFKKNLKELFQIADKYSDKVFFVGITNVDEEKTLPWEPSRYGHCWENKDIEKCNNTLKKFCEREGVLFLDMEGVVGKNDLYDGLHPNSEGHRKMFERVRDFLIKEELIDRIEKEA